MPEAESSELKLVAQAREGDPAAFGRLVERHQDALFNGICRMVGRREDAEDLAQETFVKAFRALDQHDPERQPSAWILRIANNTVIDYIRRKRPDSTRSPLTMTPGQIDRQAMRMPTPSVTPMTSTDRREFAAALKRALRRLRPKYRRCFVLRHVEQRSYAEIARIMNLPVSTVGTNLQRAREELKGMLERAAGFGAHPPPHNPTM
jgi:RNA polymerase sigma-70 factor (ECF subfamily)